MGRRNMDRKRAYDRERIRRIRAQARAEAAASTDAWYRRQLGPDHDEPPIGVTLEQHRHWCRFVMSLPSTEDIARDLNLAEFKLD